MTIGVTALPRVKRASRSNGDGGAANCGANQLVRSVKATWRDDGVSAISPAALSAPAPSIAASWTSPGALASGRNETGPPPVPKTLSRVIAPGSSACIRVTVRWRSPPSAGVMSAVAEPALELIRTVALARGAPRWSSSSTGGFAPPAVWLATASANGRQPSSPADAAVIAARISPDHSAGSRATRSWPAHSTLTAATSARRSPAGAMSPGSKATGRTPASRTR